MKDKIKEAVGKVLDSFGGFVKPSFQPVPVPVRNRNF